MNQHRYGPRAVTRILVVSLAATFVVASCGSAGAAQSVNTTAAAAAIEVTGIWVRTSAMVATDGALYLTINNKGGLDDALIAVAVDPSIAKKAELHETVAVDASASTMAAGMTTSAPVSGAMPSGTAAAGNGSMMEMRPLARLVVPAQGSVALAPGGYHIMLRDLVKPLTVGSTLNVTLAFEKSGDKVVVANVRDTAP